MDGYISKPISAEHFLAVVEGRDTEAEGPGPQECRRDRVRSRRSGFRPGGRPGTGLRQRALVRKMAELFLADSPGLLARMHEAAAAGDGAALERAAHRMKGSAANLSARRVVAAAGRLEEIARRGDLAEADATRAELEDAVIRFEHAFEDLKKEGAPCGP